MNYLRMVITALVFGILLVSCSGGDDSKDKVVAKGTRVLGIDVIAAEDDDFGAAFDMAEAAGSRVCKLSLDWKATVDNGYAYVDIADLYYPTTQSELILVLRPINTNMTTLPTGVTEPFNQAATIDAFKTFIDEIHTRTPALRAGNLIPAIYVGNEIDAYLGTNSTKWTEFTAFYDAVKTYILSLDWGAVPQVSTIGMYDGIMDASVGPFFKTIYGNADLVAVTYYPIGAGIQFEDPSCVFTDFQAIVDEFPGESIDFIECGYASGTVCGASLEKQETFVRNVFQAWDTHINEIPRIMFTWMHDIAESTADDLVIQYGFSGLPEEAAFKDYLWTLGLRTYAGSGTDKPAFVSLENQAAARGW